MGANIQIGSLSIAWTLPALIAMVAICCGVLLWWLQRRLRQRVWLPTLSIFAQSIRPRPILQVRPPPLIPFVLFTLLALALLWAGFQPSMMVDKGTDAKNPRIHVLIDLSPSVSGSLSIEKLRSDVRSVLGRLVDVGELTVGRSDQLEVVELRRSADIDRFVDALVWHRGGLRLGSFVRQQLEKATKIQRLLILSDADQYSWDDFDWRAVAVDAQISWLPLGDVYGSAKNRFIDGIQCEFLGVDLKCSVDIERRSTAGAMPEETVELAIYAGSVELSSVSAMMPAASTKLRVQALIRAAQLQETASTQFLTIKLANGDAESDVIKIDDEFFAPMLGQRQSAAMIAGISGERLVDDATYHLQKALQVRTIDVVRFDRIEQPGPKPSDFPLWLIGGGQGGGIDQFCPRSIGIAQQGQADLAATKVWLFPLGQNPDYRELCWCFARIALSDRSPSDGAPAFCSEVQDALGFSELLSSLGAKQVGGAIGQADSSFVWRVFDPVDLLVLTRAPQPETGFGFAAIPLLIGELLRLQGVLSANLVQQMVWRDGDLTKYLSGSQHTKFTNVPASESLLNRKKNSDLPPIWSADGSLEQNSSVVSPNVDRDAKFWMWSFLMLTLSVMCAEVVYGVLRHRWKSLALMMLFLFGGIDAKNACAQVQLNLIGYDQSPASVLSLSNEVESRTSIELAQRPIQFERFDQSASEKPMLWVRQLSAIAGPKGRLKPAVETWIKRGGFLVIEGDWTIERLKALIGGYSAFEGSAQWSVIPPDHELMRSFYLIQALPSCDASVWYGLQYDARLAVVAIPFRFTESLFDQSKDSVCKGAADREQRVRVFVNLMMVVLATDYKRDQIHLPEVLKRLR